MLLSAPSGCHGERICFSILFFRFPFPRRSLKLCLGYVPYRQDHMDCFETSFTGIANTAFYRYLGHLNNVAYVRFAESSRVHFFHGIPPPRSSPEHIRQWRDTCTPKGLGLILKSITIDYKYVCRCPLEWNLLSLVRPRRLS